MAGLVEPLGIWSLCTDEPPVGGVGRCSRSLGLLRVVLRVGYKFLGLIGPFLVSLENRRRRLGLIHVESFWLAAFLALANICVTNWQTFLVICISYINLV